MANAWLDTLLKKTAELQELYNLSSAVLDLLGNYKKRQLQEELNKLSVKNLNCLIKIKNSLVKDLFDKTPL
jgi:hypothetical protein